MRLPQPSKILIYLLLTFGLFLGAKAMEVNIRETAIFTCDGSCNGHLLWTFKTDKENLDILKCVQNTCTGGSNFKDRISLKPGTLSLSLYPVLYNDEGLYVVSCDSSETVKPKFLCRFHLKVLVPTTVSTSVKSNVTLHCYAHTEKQIADDNVNILWKKDDQTVLEVKKGITTYGSGFKDRASVSLTHYKDGDLSLNILRVTTSDKGLYRCYHRDSEEHGFPGSVNLNVTAEQKFLGKKFGDDLPLEGVPQRHYFITVSVLIGFVLICIFLTVWSWCHGQSQTQQDMQCIYNTVPSDVDTKTELSREPACIGFSQQETNPEPEVRPRTPVEETMPETVRTTEKQDGTKEYSTTEIVLEETI